MRCELISALRAAVDDELAKVTSSRSADLGKLIIAVDTLTRFLAEAKPKPEVAQSVYTQDPHKVLEDIVDRWIAADEAQRAEDEAERRAQGLPANELEAAQMRIAELEAENARLRGEDLKALPSPPEARAITPSESEIIPPGEIEDRPPATPPVAKSGDETKAQMARVNSDRSIEHRVMGNPRMPQPDAGGFHWGGSKGRAW